MNRRRYQLNIRQIMLLILLGTVWVQLHVSWRDYHLQVLGDVLRKYFVVQDLSGHEERLPEDNCPNQISD